MPHLHIDWVYTTSKTELEDLGLKYTEPEVFQDILSKIKASKEEQDFYIKRFSDKLEKNPFQREVLLRNQRAYEIHLFYS